MKGRQNIEEKSSSFNSDSLDNHGAKSEIFSSKLCEYLCIMSFINIYTSLIVHSKMKTEFDFKLRILLFFYIELFHFLLKPFVAIHLPKISCNNYLRFKRTLGVINKLSKIKLTSDKVLQTTKATSPTSPWLLIIFNLS